ncbi:MAG: T9SS type A sorting domain-containing protein [Flavobacteriales bacterium]|nr:T9SS type A sorting domain-containing protein [Flavobacteriales bacterium]
MRLVLICVSFLLSVSCLYAQTFYPVSETTITFNDPTRTGGFGSGGGPGRQIETKIYYPATNAGTNQPVAGNNLPVVVFGHGFAMAWDAYEPIYDSLAGRGFIVALPRTEGSLLPAPSHGDFGKDLALVSEKMVALNTTPTSIFYQKLNGRRAIGGHSMGGGATYLANQNTSGVNCYFTFAAAETNPSAITAAASMTAPNLVIAGSIDCVAPPASNQVPIYNAIGSACKTYISITGGYHCHFNSDNFNCTFGEGTCSPSGGLTRADQLNKVRSIIIPYLTYFLKGECAAWTQFETLTNSANWLTKQQVCTQNIPVAATINGPASYCQGDMAQLEANPTGFSYLWSTGETTGQIEVSQPQTLTVQVSNGICSINSPSFSISEIPSVQSASVSASGALSFCTGGQVVLTASPSGFPVLWSNGATTPNITVNQSGEFSAFVGNPGCGAQTDTLQTVLNAFPQPIQINAPQGSLLIGTSQPFSVTDQPGITYLWTVQDGTILSGQGTSQITASWAAPGLYNVTCIADNQGCVVTDEVLVNITLPVSVSESMVQEFVIYPNPATHHIIIETAETDFIYEISDMQGRVLLSGISESGKIIPVMALPPGVYALNLKNEIGVYFGSSRFIKL